jgi:hypothetical protein
MCFRKEVHDEAEKWKRGKATPIRSCKGETAVR